MKIAEKREKFCVFCQFRCQFEIGFILKTAIISSEKPTGQQLCAMLSIFELLIQEVCQKFLLFEVFSVILGTFGSTKKVQKSPQRHMARS